MKRFISSEEAGKAVSGRGGEYAVVQNPAYIYAPHEYYPLAPKITGPIDKVAGIVCDMDGTTTTTENLCLHSLEAMIRRITGQPSRDEWPGLAKGDYAHIIGNSTTRHVEYLIETYEKDIESKPFVRSVLEAAVWTLVNGEDLGRKREVAANLKNLKWDDVLLQESEWKRMLDSSRFDAEKEKAVLDTLAEKYADKLAPKDFTTISRLAIDVYYYRYHEILSQIARGEAGKLSEELLGGKRLIEPMSGVAVFLALIKGWLGEKAGELYDFLVQGKNEDAEVPCSEEGKQILSALGTVFQNNPAKIAVVTSSIKYEADIVLSEVLKVVKEQVAEWPVHNECADRFTRIEDVYDAFITASDSSEIRLKPHRDLYSIALHALGFGPEDFGYVVGLEDSESGTIAIRAAGIGLCVAVPFSDTAGHDFGAASYVMRGGLPETILCRNMFLGRGKP